MYRLGPRTIDFYKGWELESNLHQTLLFNDETGALTGSVTWIHVYSLRGACSFHYIPLCSLSSTRQRSGMHSWETRKHSQGRANLWWQCRFCRGQRQRDILLRHCGRLYFQRCYVASPILHTCIEASLIITSQQNKAGVLPLSSTWSGLMTCS